MIVTYHNHTSWSDGAATLDEMIRGAQEIGIDELGISDHYTLPPDGRQFDWSMPLGFLDEYVAAVRQAAEAHDAPVLRLGIEADFYPETVELVRERLARHPFDYLIGSVHAVGDFLVDYRADAWEPFSQEERNAIWGVYWERVRQMANSRAFDIVGHFDLPKKFTFLPTVDYTAEMLAALDAVAEADMALEINTAGWTKPIHEAYPSIDILYEAHCRDIPLVINADAHRPDDLANLFAYARELAISAGYRESYRFEARRRYPLSLEA